MEITLPLSSLITIAIGSVGVAVSLFMGVFLFIQKRKVHVSVGLLSVLLVLSGLTLLNNVLVTSGISNRIQELYFIPIFYSLSIPPLFYLFVKSKYRFRLDRMDLVHGIVPMIQALVYLIIGFRSVEFKSALYSEQVFQLYLQAESVLFILFMAGYSLFALSLLRKKEAKAYFWTEDLRTWLLRFTAGMLIISLIEAGLFVVEYSLPAQHVSSIPFNLFHSFVLSAFVFWISVNAFKQYFPLQIFVSRPSEEDAMISDEQLAELKKALGSLMSRDHIYLNPDLNLELLANYLGISEKSCSYLLNSGMNENFNQYVNSFRVEAFRNRIKKGDHSDLTLTAIAYECGFNSKSTFNRVFKTISGLTPSEYVKQAT